MIGKLIVFNTTVIVALFLAWLYGIVDFVIGTDIFWLSRAIALYGFFSLGLFAYSAVKISRWYGEMRSADRGDAEDIFETFVLGETYFLRRHDSNLVTMGLLGTLIGVAYALSGADASTFGNIESASATVAHLMQGMYVAIFTTIVGTVFHLWLSNNIAIVEKHGKRILEEVS